MTTTPFASLDDYYALPRIDAAVTSPDGARVVLTVATLTKDRTGYERSLWVVPADGTGAPRRLTRSTTGESGAVFTSTGDLLFVSARPDNAADDDAPAQLWLLPAAGGEARPVTRLAGGVAGVATAADSDRIVVASSLLPEATTIEADARLRAERKKLKVTAIVHDTYPVRYWDHDLGPHEPALLSLDLRDLAEAPAVVATADEAVEAVSTGESDVADEPYPAGLPRPRILVRGRAASAAGMALTPDGATLVVALREPQGRDARFRLVAIDTATAAQRIVRDEVDVDLETPVVSHDGAHVAYVRTEKSTPAGPADQELWIDALDGSDPRRLAAGWDRWPSSIRFAHDDASLIVTADHDGRGPVFRVPVNGDPVEQLTTDDFAYTNVETIAGSSDLTALRSNWMTPPHPVRVSASGVTPLASPAPLPATAADMVEVETTADDGARVRGWLVLPEGADAAAPAPLLLWVHGGPLNSWNAWSWRWSPQLAAARGYAVLLPDPALSTGYGLDFIARGWNAWGGAPYTDLMALTDAVVARDDIDQTRTAAMGGSFGGYMANWIAGHTDRFDAIVTHASLWAFDQFAGTTDFAPYWQSIFTPEGAIENSPHRFVRDIRTPMLVIHGDRDYRVPIGEGLRLWADLNEHHAAADGTSPHRFLYYPDENHWILSPQNARVWYETVFTFLEENLPANP
ncbi:S9 family peptidase [Microbacterium imperiale]|uniref:Peptidase S9 n=1 Tax=Microbacterium imperiale TaxID=33884 RepID=A0A9W6HI54_9MICO|nr:alpha/beta fold hydrolase [Microbacterium imperiale]MBP2421666.1 dipeptidyl aminopeptidase/acylaminoacyl peptidase [Microbacterium imperiale]MDS0199231.1 prolyl oligopeptidase family serine peptidase [Microbacterium imperiale]BFE42008.1 S9 family peptidase [Microbacterium imperiale]GLJ80961.1 peptidase S9 [Microbacterium imperiale]